MSDDEYPDLGLTAYTAYGLQVGGVTHDSKPLPRWADLGDRGQTAWRAAAEAAVNVLRDEDAAQFPGVLLTSAPQVPYQGRIVIVPMDPVTNNGADTAPAVITRVWPNDVINVQILADQAGCAWRTSLQYVEDLSTVASDDPARLYRWTWPPRF